MVYRIYRGRILIFYFSNELTICKKYLRVLILDVTDLILYNIYILFDNSVSRIKILNVQIFFSKLFKKLYLTIIIKTVIICIITSNF